jgi:phage baseplate assembly protein gpV
MIEIARVVASHPEKHKVDLVVLATGRRIAGAKVMSGMAGGNVGFSDLPAPDVDDPENPYDTGPTGKRDILAVVSHTGGVPIVLGFIHPEIAQTLFADKNRMMYRHASDFYATIDAKGNFIARHPSGTYIGIGDTATLPDLTGLDYNGLWQMTQNAESNAHIHLAVANKANGQVTALSIGPDGVIAIASAGNLTITAPNLTFVGDVTVTGKLDVNGPSLQHNGVNVGDDHKHKDTQPGGGQSGTPVV